MNSFENPSNLDYINHCKIRFENFNSDNSKEIANLDAKQPAGITHLSFKGYKLIKDSIYSNMQNDVFNAENTEIGNYLDALEMMDGPFKINPKAKEN